ncbi:MAG: sulfate ABC transporter permease subunit CysT [Planctomycetaceae bacterium]|jgi:sulfate transport system permease protein|nr:sulfate ABC transporter permease subunit CysT [Planctomycetaceae bacterium]
MKVIPGFRLTLGITVFYLSLIVLIPLSLLVWNTTELKWAGFVKIVTTKQVIASYKLTFTAAFFAALCNALFGFMTAWALVRYKFFGKKLFDALIDLPFAMPTAVSGIALTALFVDNGWLGTWFCKIGINVVKFAERFRLDFVNIPYLDKENGLQTAFSPIGVFIALTFIGLPFVVRTLQPALQDLDKEVEEAAASLGANRFQTFWRVIFPSVLPALLTGFVLAFARALGEYGSVVFISGNIPMKTEITPLLIFAKLEEFNYAGATAISVVMLAASFVLMLMVNIIQWRTRRK